MPKAKSYTRKNYYAVRVGREGPKVYTTWEDCLRNTSRFPGNSYKGHATLKEAEDWIAPFVNNAPPPAPPAPTAPSRLAPGPPRPQANVTPPAPSQPKDTPSVKLSQTQQQVFNRVKRGQNVFFTGSAGTGKSLLMREIINYKGGRISARLAITAATGIAACNIGGTTLHSWAGIGRGIKDGWDFAGKMLGLGQTVMKKVLERWRMVDTLIIDEISMLDGDLFDALETCARRVRNSEKPFGGIQLILSGDFCQLPPVPLDGKAVKFAFDAESWYPCMGPPVILTKVFRQKEQTFVDMLNEMRFGNLKPETIEKFRQLARPVTYTDGIEATGLYSTRVEVEGANMKRLRELSGPSKIFRSTDRAGRDSNGKHVSEAQMKSLLEKRTISLPEVELRIGAQVMLIKNIIQGVLVNGSVGHVIGFKTPRQARDEKQDIAGIDSDPSVPQNQYDREKLERAKEFEWPLVKFANGRELLVIPSDFTVENADGEMEAMRIQIPLIHAWALSVHKSQGQTLERVLVDLRRTFENGQAYVALSRATRMDQLQVLNFHPSKVRAHPRVLEWYNHSVAPQQDGYLSDEEMDEEFDIAFTMS